MLKNHTQPNLPRKHKRQSMRADSKESEHRGNLAEGRTETLPLRCHLKETANRTKDTVVRGEQAFDNSSFFLSLMLSCLRDLFFCCFFSLQKARTERERESRGKTIEKIEESWKKEGRERKSRNKNLVLFLLSHSA